MRDKQLMAIIYKEFLQINIKTYINIPTEKQTKDINGWLTKDKIQHMENLFKRFKDVIKYLK